MTHQTANPSRRAALLANAEADRDAAFDNLKAARKRRDDLQAELQRITGELQQAIAVANTEVRTAAADLAEVEDVVKALTPRKPRTPRNVNTADRLMTGGDDDVATDES